MKVCPECKAEVNDESAVCQFCGCPFPEPQKNEASVEKAAEYIEPQKPAYESTVKPTETKSVNWSFVLKVSLWVLAGIILIMAFYSAGKISDGAAGIGDIRSVGGETMEEVYYLYLGHIYAGLANVVRMLGIFFASILAWCGYKA